jgi:hypothetical protein
MRVGGEKMQNAIYFYYSKYFSYMYIRIDAKTFNLLCVGIPRPWPYSALVQMTFLLEFYRIFSYKRQTMSF